MKLAYTATYDPKDINKWSGLGFYIGKSLYRQNINLRCLPPLKEKYKYLFIGKQLLYKYIFDKIYLREREPAILMGYARQIQRHLSKVDVDLLFCPGTLPIAYLEYNKPIVFWTDATFQVGMEYAGSKIVARESIENGHRMEKSALERCALAIYSSDWAARSAIEYYKAPPEKVKVVPFGANLDTDLTLKDIEEIISSRSRSTCNLLFVGTDWERKGGAKVLKVAQELHRQGLQILLHVVGCQPSIRPLPDYVRVYGFISKGTLEGRQKMAQLFSQAHYLLMFSKAEAYGLVFCEANAFGIPCIASNVGGIPTIIKDEMNGRLFSEDDDINNICSFIYQKYSDFNAYVELAKSSFNEYQMRLNWKVAGKKVKEYLLLVT